MADQIFKRKKLAVERRRKHIQKERSQKWLIVCEGSKTEPLYIKSLIDYCNSISHKAPIIAEVYGEGKNTKSLVRSVDDFLEETEEYKTSSLRPFEKIFVVFDKDSFAPEQFDNAIKMSCNRGYIPIWSNECFELWYLLHFNLYENDCGRNFYFSKLTDLLGHKYDKAEDVFSEIFSPNNIRTAINNSKYLEKKFSSEKSFAKKVPCTQMHVLIDEIERKLDIKI